MKTPVKGIQLIFCLISLALISACSATNNTANSTPELRPHVVDNGYQLVPADNANQSNIMVHPNRDQPTNMSLTEYAASSLDSFNATRQSAHDIASYKTELSIQYTSTYQSESGTNLDIEMSKLLEVERAYQASAKLLATIDDMFTILLNSVGR